MWKIEWDTKCFEFQLEWVSRVLIFRGPGVPFSEESATSYQKREIQSECKNFIPVTGKTKGLHRGTDL